MKDKQYYIDLADRYFDAETSLAEEKELREFLAATDDADFEEVKVVMGFMVLESKAYGQKPKANTNVIRWLVVTVAAAVVALIIVVPFFKMENHDCVMIAEGKTTTDHEIVIDEMDRQMAMLFSLDDETSMESEMAVIFK